MRLLLLAASLLGLAHSVSAQQMRTPAIGDRLKVRHAVLSGGEVKRVLMVGRLDSLVRDTVFVSRGPIAMSNVATVDLSIGRQPTIARDAFIGLVLGAVVGQVFVNRKVNGEVFQTQADLEARKKELRPTVALIALVGAGAGAAVGKRGHEAWVRIDANTLRAALDAARR
jgi:hypothetical protein